MDFLGLPVLRDVDVGLVGLVFVDPNIQDLTFCEV